MLQHLRAALLEDFEDELLLACRLAVLLAVGYRDAEIRRKLGASLAEYTRAKDRVKRAAGGLDSVGPDEL